MPVSSNQIDTEINSQKKCDENENERNLEEDGCENGELKHERADLSDNAGSLTSPHHHHHPQLLTNHNDELNVDEEEEVGEEVLDEDDEVVGCDFDEIGNEDGDGDGDCDVICDNDNDEEQQQHDEEEDVVDLELNNGDEDDDDDEIMGAASCEYDENGENSSMGGNAEQMQQQMMTASVKMMNKLNQNSKNCIYLSIYLIHKMFFSFCPSCQFVNQIDSF